MNIESLYSKDLESDLNERERTILRKIVQLYILKAAPIGSRFLSKYIQEDLKLSPATLRNVMADLEEMDFICHPHTSAGRIPTDKGYRFYVNTLKRLEELSDHELKTVNQNISASSSEAVLKNASLLLGRLSHHLGVVQIPHVSNLTVLKIELISISSTRVLVVIALDSNIVRTVTLEAEIEFDLSNLGKVSAYINEKVSGRPLNFLRDNFKDLIKEFEEKDTALVRLFTESIDSIFAGQGNNDRILIAGTQNLIEQPEFKDLESMRGVIELVENEDVIIHLLDKHEDNDGIRVLIGGEMDAGLLKDYSLISSSYKIGTATGSIGLIGPKRMNYPKMISIVRSVSRILNKEVK